REHFQLRPITVSVQDTATGKAVPARITITDTKDHPVELFYALSEETAVRPGVIYTRGTATRLELPEGEYFVYATRGMEWSRPRERLSLHGDGAPSLALRITREVDTTGFIAADTHIH